MSYFESEEFRRSPSFGGQPRLPLAAVGGDRPRSASDDGPELCWGRSITHEGLGDGDACDTSHADLMLGVRLACLAYTDDRPGAVKQLAGARDAIATIAGGADKAQQPLSCILADLGYTVDRLFSHTSIGRNAPYDTQGFIAHDDSNIVLAYRGTTGPIDMMTSLFYSVVPFDPFGDEAKPISATRAVLWRLKPSVLRRKRARRTRCARSWGNVHRGFFDAFMSSVRDIEEVIMPQLQAHRAKRLVIAGHSLGGALAHAALAYFLKAHDFSVSPHSLLMVSCGSPRLGDVHFRRWVRCEVEALRGIGKCSAARLVHQCDGIPNLPPGRMSYAHATPMTFLSHTGDLVLEKAVNRSPERFARYFSDHCPNIYLTSLERATPAHRDIVILEGASPLWDSASEGCEFACSPRSLDDFMVDARQDEEISGGSAPTAWRSRRVCRVSCMSWLLSHVVVLQVPTKLFGHRRGLFSQAQLCAADARWSAPCRLGDVGVGGHWLSQALARLSQCSIPRTPERR